MSSAGFFHSTLRVTRRSAEGFTLVELMVAMTGGLFLSIVVFALSRDASRFYQSEGRVANATSAGLSGFERLSSDVARAGHLVTPNINADPHVCNRPQPTWPAMLQRLRAVLIETDTTASDLTEVGDAGIKPQGIVIAGALNMPEVLVTQGVGENGAGWQISINTTTPAAARMGLSRANAATAANQAVLERVFIPKGNGRIVRLRRKGMDQYGVVSAVAAAPSPDATRGALATVDLAATTQLVRPSNGGAQCGIEGDGGNMDLSVIDLVRYNIRPMVADANYAALFKASGLGTGGGANAPPYEAKRAELVRVELTPAGIEIDDTREIVGEYAVDLQLGAWAATNALNPALVPVTVAVDNTYASTQLIRGVHVRLSVRSREADRDADVTGIGVSVNDHYRIGLKMPAVAGVTPVVYARVRTFQADIPLRNLENSLW